MKTALIVTSSANGDASVSSGLAATLAAGSATATRRSPHPRDVGADPLPHLTRETVAAIKGEPKTD